MSEVQKKQPLKLELIHWSQLEQQERPPYLVKGLLNSTSLSVLYGEPGSMKTFVAIDLAAHVARDIPWHGCRVHGGPVLYVACEGGRSIEDRLAAFCKHHRVERADVPFYILPRTVNLRDPEGRPLRALIDAVKDKEEEAGDRFKLIVIDTLSRALVGGNENGPDDMGLFVAQVDTIRLNTSAHVLVIHHTGKDVDRGARGHSSLKAAADTEIVVTKADDVCLVRSTKQRDMATDFEIGFRWHVVELGVDEDGDPLTSLALRPTEDRPAPKMSLPKAARDALDVLWKAIKAEGVPSGGVDGPPIDAGLHAIAEDRWRELCAGLPLSRGSENAANKAYRRARDKLVEAGMIGARDPWVWPWPKEVARGADEIPF